MSGTSARHVAKVLSGDLLPWERQPGEGEKAYAAFKAWLDSDKRRVRDHGPSALNWSSEWSWSARAHEFDVYTARVDLEDQIRYRLKMNERHRRIGSAAQSKVVGWLSSLTEEAVARMSVADATRLLDTAVRIERAATSDADLEEPDWAYDEPGRENGSLKQRLVDAGLDVPMSDVAYLLHKVLGPSHPEPPSPRPAPPAPKPAPVDGQELGFGETSDDTSTIDIWGDNPLGPGRPKYGGLA